MDKSIWEVLNEYVWMSMDVPHNNINSKSINKSKDWPYDSNNPDRMYGTPGDYSRDSNSEHPSHTYEIEPTDVTSYKKDTDNDGFKKFNKKKRKDEVLGAPMLLSKAGNAGMMINRPGIATGFERAPNELFDDGEEISETWQHLSSL